MNDREITIREIYARRQQKKRRRRAWIISFVILALLAAAAAVLLPKMLRKSENDPAPTTPTTLAPTDESTEPPTEENTEPTTEPTQPVTEPEDNSLYLEQAQKVLDTMTLEEKVYQMLVITPEQLTGVETATRSGDATREAIEKYPVGGLVYFAQNIEDPEQITEMISNVQSYSKLGLFIAVDEEGGSVSRIASNSAMGTTVFGNMATVADAAEAKNVGKTIGADIAKFGFNLNFAPVADVNADPDNDVIGSRAFSSDFETAAELVAACVEGYKESGVLCTLKHFPGHGTTDADSHSGSANTSRTLEEMLAGEFVPFSAGIDAGADLVMVGHITCRNVVGSSTPASLSKMIVTDILRGNLKFNGLVITDAMNMDAITDNYSAASAAVQAVQAGCDILLMPEDMEAAVGGILSALEDGSLTEERINESVLRILAAKLEAGIIVE